MNDSFLDFCGVYLSGYCPFTRQEEIRVATKGAENYLYKGIDIHGSGLHIGMGLQINAQLTDFFCFFCFTILGVKQRPAEYALLGVTGVDLISWTDNHAVHWTADSDRKMMICIKNDVRFPLHL